MIIVLLIIIILIIIVLLIINKKSEQFINKNTKASIGNLLSIYFYGLGKSIIEQKDYIIDSDNIVLELPANIKIKDYKELSKVYNCFIDSKNNINIDFFNKNRPDGLWECVNKQKETFWICMKPIINKLLNEAFIKNALVKKVDNTIIHYRCSDAPFIRFFPYHFQKYKFFKDALNEIKQTSNILDNKKITILFNSSHSSPGSKGKEDKNSAACDIYVNELKKYLTDLGYIINIESTSTLDDFAMMFYAPAVISTCSSYSFMSGFFGMGKFISGGHYNEFTDNIIECKDCGNWLYKGYELNHKDVKDYYDTKTVINQLK